MGSEMCIRDRPQIDGRGSFNSVSHRSLAVSFEVPNWSSQQLAARLVRPLTSRVTCVWWQVPWRHQTTAVPACDGRRADGHGGLRQRCANSGRVCLQMQEFLRSADCRRRLAPENSRMRNVADHLLKLGTRQADPLSTASRCYSIVLTNVFDLSHPVTMLCSCSH